MFPTQKRARDSPLGFMPAMPSFNHGENLAKWALMVREVGRQRQPFIPLEDLRKLLKNDPPDQQMLHVELLRRVTVAILKGRRAENPNYYHVSKKGTRELWAGFAVSDETVSAPAARNISSRHYCAPLRFEVREGNRCVATILVTIIEGKMDIVGDRQELVSFLV